MSSLNISSVGSALGSDASAVARSVSWMPRGRIGPSTRSQSVVGWAW
ncbi:hypothetical protein [Streptomyces flavidovirens]